MVIFGGGFWTEGTGAAPWWPRGWGSVPMEVFVTRGRGGTLCFVPAATLLFHWKMNAIFLHDNSAIVSSSLGTSVL